MTDPEEKIPEIDLGLSLIATLGSSDLPNITQDLTEVALDSVLKDGILREIPIIGSIVGLTKTVISIRDKLLIRKIVDFLRAIDITQEGRMKFLDDIQGDVNYQRKIGENLIMLLDHLDDLDKTTMVAQLFKSYLKDELTYDEFLQFASVIERAFIHDIKGLLGVLTDPKNSGYDFYAKRLYLVGLAEIKFDDEPYLPQEPGQLRPPKSPFHEPIKFELSKDAFVLAQILLGKRIHGTDFVRQYRSNREYRTIYD